MKRLIVRFLLKNSSHSLDIITNEDDARKFIKQWQDSTHGKTSYTEAVSHFGGHDVDNDRYWSILVSDISTIFTINPEKIAADQRRLEEQRQQTAAQRYARPPETPLYPPYQYPNG